MSNGIETAVAVQTTERYQAFEGTSLACETSSTITTLSIHLSIRGHRIRMYPVGKRALGTPSSSLDS
jgi:hypothetical protein